MRISFFRSLALLVASLSLAAAISGGARKVRLGEHPAVVRIPGCTATLISPGVVLTAQHCIMFSSDKQITSRQFKVTFPPLSNGKKGFKVGVTRVERHEDFVVYDVDLDKRTLRNPLRYIKRIIRSNLDKDGVVFPGDIALLYLDQCIADRLPVKIGTTSGLDDPRACDIVQGVGYGNLNSGGAWGTVLQGGTGDRGAVSTARTNDMRALSPQTCSYATFGIVMNFINKRFFSDPTAPHYYLKGVVRNYAEKQYLDITRYTHNIVDEPLVCASAVTEEMQMLNRGDSGGPLFLDGVLVGVASQHGGTSVVSAAGAVAYYTKVSHYGSWIVQLLLAKDSCSMPGSRRLRFDPRTIFKMPDKASVVKYLKDSGAMKYLMSHYSTALPQHFLSFNKVAAWKLTERLRQMDTCPALKHEVEDEVDYLQRRLFTARVGNRRLGAFYDDQPEVFDQSDDEEQVGGFMKQVKKVQRHIGHRQKRWNKGFLFDQSEEPTCCFCFNGGDGSGGCLTVQQCNAKPTYYCNQVGPESGCQLAGDTCF